MSKYTTRTDFTSDLNTMIEAGTLPAKIIATLANALDQLEDTEKCSGCGKMSTQYRNSYGNKISRCLKFKGTVENRSMGGLSI